MSKFAEFIESVALIIIVLLLARGIHWLIFPLVETWGTHLQLALSFAIAIVLLIVGVAQAHNSLDKGNQ